MRSHLRPPCTSSIAQSSCVSSYCSGSHWAHFFLPSGSSSSHFVAPSTPLFLQKTKEPKEETKEKEREARNATEIINEEKRNPPCFEFIHSQDLIFHLLFLVRYSLYILLRFLATASDDAQFPLLSHAPRNLFLWSGCTPVVHVRAFWDGGGICLLFSLCMCMFCLSLRGKNIHSRNCRFWPKNR